MQLRFFKVANATTVLLGTCTCISTIHTCTYSRDCLKVTWYFQNVIYFKIAARGIDAKRPRDFCSLCDVKTNITKHVKYLTKVTFWKIFIMLETHVGISLRSIISVLHFHGNKTSIIYFLFFLIFSLHHMQLISFLEKKRCSIMYITDICTITFIL